MFSCVGILSRILTTHTHDNLPIWQILAFAGKWDVAQKVDSSRSAGSLLCDVTEILEDRRKQEP